MTKLKWTKKQYMNKECTHHEYYCQFVDKWTIDQLIREFGVDLLKKAYKTNKAFNSISLRQWDLLAVYGGLEIRTKSLLKEAGDFYTQSDAVCILKNAAEMIVNNEWEEDITQ